MGVVIVAKNLYVRVAFVIYFILIIIKSIPYIALCIFKSFLQIFRTCYSLTFKRITSPETYSQEVFHAPWILLNVRIRRSIYIRKKTEKNKEKEENHRDVLNFVKYPPPPPDNSHSIDGQSCMDKYLDTST